jgi:hypothetical protein
MEQHGPVPPLIFIDAQADIMLEKIGGSRCTAAQLMKVKIDDGG